MAYPHTAPDLVRPTADQLAWQQLRLGVFVHFGINTFFDQEWSNGTLPASAFAPTELDARQWVRTAVALGARYLVLTAKHHDGFCLWPTETTGYSVAASPWRDGRGDLVREVADACAEAGIGLGLYLSPWDRNSPVYPDPAAYDELYCRQLAELCTGYGPLVELWFDGAGSEGRRYDWTSIMNVVHTQQPHAMVFNMGDPTIRWAGNENGVVDEPVEYVVDHTQMSNYTVVTTQFERALYLPPECNVSLRPGWFWHPDEEPKTLDHLLAIHYRSIGRGANLLLNLAPDRRGLVPAGDSARVVELGAALADRFGAPVHASVRPAQAAPEHRWWTVEFPRPTRLDHVELREDLTDGQRVTGHLVLDADGATLAAGSTVGVRRVHAFAERTVTALRVRLAGADGVLAGVAGYHAGTSVVPELPAAYLAPTDYPED